ncbi:uncharacterized protein GGS25DRAFT_516723 [Hypoxylon fragiforme]|uniref:uncharacterized protein n=1 Tax=Hypoxylon fragiforme TaxID=63214 RepID=UPI0020C72041|nr:uncharacterized protein GGS25DRAFT_516723 [Hypoxylon fragiforme]KAI2613862.1 hypothetical protein GGS25DRAFT_516723 [Hypoxylon fragiforme]
MSTTSPEQKFISEVWGLQGTAYVVVALRYYSRFTVLGWRCLAWDDILMLLAIMAYTAESVMAYLVVAHWKGLANNAMTDEQRAALDPQSLEWGLRVNGSKTHVCGLLLYTTLLWLLKACWLLYYSRLAYGVYNTRRVIHGGIVITAGSYVACLLVALFKCVPFDHQWQINPSPGNHCMPAISTIQTVFVMVMNTLSDFYLMAIPLPLIWRSNLPLRKKLILLVMFSGGFLEMAFGILRCVSILTVGVPRPPSSPHPLAFKLGDTDPSQSGYWSVRESFVCIVLTNLPMVYPLFKRFIDKGRSVTGTKSVTTRGYKLNSMPSRANGNYRRQQQQQQQAPYSGPNNDGAWDSKEQIIHGRGHGPESSIEAGTLSDMSAEPAPSDHIVVTTEFTIIEPSPRGSRTSSRET